MQPTLAALLALLICAPGCSAADEVAPDRPSLSVVDDRVVAVAGLSARTLDDIAALDDAERAALLTVRTAAADGDPDAPTVLGRTRVEGGRLVFEPRFPFAAGMTFVARYAPRPGAEEARLEFRIAARDTPGDTHVVAVYPSADVWPMNQLKMYIHFSAPMRAGRAFEHIRLVDRRSGEEVEQPFVTVQEELWDRERTVLTVLYDPARIKRGLVPNQEAGLPLQAGGSYRLVVDAGWRDARGHPLSAPYARDFRVGAADRISPRPADWRIEVPDAGTREPLSITFDEPLDRGLLHSLLGIRRSTATDGDGDWRTTSDTDPSDELVGDVEVTDDETMWRFRPTEPWRQGSYEIVVPTIVEDLAGNTLRGLFDAEVGAAPTRFARAEAAYRTFEVTSPGSRPR